MILTPHNLITRYHVNNDVVSFLFLHDCTPYFNQRKKFYHLFYKNINTIYFQTLKMITFLWLKVIHIYFTKN